MRCFKGHCVSQSILAHVIAPTQLVAHPCTWLVLVSFVLIITRGHATAAIRQIVAGNAWLGAIEGYSPSGNILHHHLPVHCTLQ